MATSPYPIACQTPYYASADLTAATACTTRAPTATASLAGANIIQLTNTSTNGLRIDSIQVQASSTSISATTAAQIVGLWMWDGTKAYLINEIAISAQTPSTTSAAFATTVTFTNPINVPAANKLYVSTTVTTTASTTALVVNAYGGSY